MNKTLNNDEQKILDEKFIRAVISGNEDQTLEYLNQGASLNYKNGNGDSALFIAADRRQLNVFNMLLSYQSPYGEQLDLDSRNIMGETALMHLLKNYNFDKYIELLIKAGADVNIPDFNNITPLIRVCGNKNPELVIKLLNAPNIDVNYAVPKTLTTAFLMATSEGDLETSVLLHQAGANPNAIDMQGRNALINALFKNNSHYTKKEKERFLLLCEFLLLACDVNYVATSGVTAFWIASAMKQKEFCLKMIEKNVNVDVFHELGMDGLMTPLHIWCQIGDQEMIEKVITAGGKLGVKDSKGNTPEAYAFMRPKLRSFIIDYGIDMNTILYSKDGVNIPIFSLAVSSGDKQIEIVKEMLKQGAEPVLTSKTDYPNDDINEPIVIAVANLAKNIVKELLATGKIDTNRKYKISKNSESVSLIGMLFNGTMNSAFSEKMQQKKHYESILKENKENDRNGIQSELMSKEDLLALTKELDSLKSLEGNLEVYRSEIFNDLIAHGASLNNKNEKGNTEIFFANKIEYIDLLVSNGANLFHENDAGQDLLYYSVLNNKIELIPYLKQKFQEENHLTVKNLFYQLAFENATNQVVQQYIKNGILNFLDGKNDKEIQKAFGVGLEKDELPPIVSVPNINYQDEDGNSALLVACANNNTYLVEIYLKIGADINLKNNQGETPIMHALNTNSSLLVKLLMKHGANIHAVNNDGVSFLTMAEELNNKEVSKHVQIALDKEQEDKELKAKQNNQEHIKESGEIVDSSINNDLLVKSAKIKP